MRGFHFGFPHEFALGLGRGDSKQQVLISAEGTCLACDGHPVLATQARELSCVTSAPLFRVFPRCPQSGAQFPKVLFHLIPGLPNILQYFAISSVSFISVAGFGMLRGKLPRPRAGPLKVECKCFWT